MVAHIGIPALIHQTWKDTDVPPEWQKWADSWRIQHPGWGYRLWTDADNRAFLQEHYPWFLPVYDGYPEAIMRADAIRYFLLDHFGGLYVDLDFECLKPVTEILDGHDLVLGCEPDAHTRLLLARQRGFDRIVGNAFIASRPGHPFWAHVHRQMVATHKLPSTLDVTGPFFLTRAVESAPEPESITVLEAEVLYPEVSPYATELFGPQEADYDRAHAVHHWSGSWTYNTSGTPRISAGKRFPFWASQEMQPVADGLLSLDAQRRRWAAGAPAPTVSCLMVTKDRSATARRAIRCFLTQTYPNLELVVVEDGTDDALAQHIRDLGDPRIRHHRLPRRGGRWANCAMRRWTGPPGPTCASGTTTTCMTRSGSRRRWPRFSRSAPRRVSSPASGCGGPPATNSRSPVRGSGKGRWCARRTGSRATRRNAAARTPQWRKGWSGTAGSYRWTRPSCTRMCATGTTRSTSPISLSTSRWRPRSGPNPALTPNGCWPWPPGCRSSRGTSPTPRAAPPPLEPPGDRRRSWNPSRLRRVSGPWCWCSPPQGRLRVPARLSGQPSHPGLPTRGDLAGTPGGRQQGHDTGTAPAGPAPPRGGVPAGHPRTP